MGLLKRLSQWGFARNDESKSTNFNRDILRRCHFEIMESRRVLSAEPVIAGITYLENDGGQDTTPDYFEVTFQGGADTTLMSHFTINGDQDRNGILSDGDMFFDVDDSQPGAGGYHAFLFDAERSVGVTASDVQGVFVGENGLFLTVRVANFEAGDVFAFTIDVDEVERFRYDKIASGVEFEGSFFQANFVDENYVFESLNVSTNAVLEDGYVQYQQEGIFYDNYDQLFAEGEKYVEEDLVLPRDNETGQANRTAGTIDAYELIPKPITISGNVYHDENLNCEQDSDESGIAGVEIRLQKFNDNSGRYEHVATTRTDSDGRYEFGLEFGLQPGIYRLVEIQPDGYLDVGASAGNVEGNSSGDVSRDASHNQNIIANINIPLGGTSATDYDFKEVLPASLSGNVYHDRNDNGVRDPSEEGIANVLIQVTRVGAKDGVTDDPFAGTDSIFIRTNANGRFTVDGLPPGIYEVIEINNYPPGEDPLAAYIDGKDTAGKVGGQTVGHNSANDKHTQIELCAGDDGIEYNFGELKPAAISGYVSVATPGEAKLDPSDPGFKPIAGVTVRLFDANGIRVASTVTDLNGLYEFTDLRPGTYTVVEVQPDGYLDGADFVGKVAGETTGVNRLNDRFDGIVVGSGQQATRYDFCEYIPASLKGTVFHDRNDDGVQNAGEEGLGGVIIQLYDAEENLVSEVRTDANGDYCFENLLAGEYKIREIQPAAFVDGKESVGSVMSADGTSRASGFVHENDEFCEIILAGGDQGSEYNFGEFRLASISGSVFADGDGDKSNYDPSAGDGPIEGVELVLLDSAGEEVARTRTDANGNYHFDGLRPGEYSVREITPDGYLDGLDSVGTVDGQRVGVVANDLLSSIVLGSGSAGINYDFCEHIPAEIHGHVFHDLDNDGRFEAGEVGIQGTIIRLFTQNGQFVTQTQTMEDGAYWFTDLMPGVYKIREIQPESYVDGKDRIGTVEGKSTGNVLNDIFTHVRVNGGQAGINYDFGEIRLAEISGRVHVDTDGNCVFNPNAGDRPLANVTLELLNANGEILATTQTDSTGKYTFGQLLPGEYSIRQQQPDGYFTGGERVGDGGGQASLNLLTGINVVSGQKLTQYNFCEHEAAEIHGRVWEDGPAFQTEDGRVPENYRGQRDGVYQANVDTPLAGVRMRLYYYIDPTTEEFSPRPVTLGEVLGEHYTHMGTTDPDAPVWIETSRNGEYKFLGLQAGNYIVLEEQPLNYVDANEIAGTTSGLVFNSQDDVRGASGNLRIFSGAQLMDAIVAIQVSEGDISRQNNFTEVRAEILPPNPTGPTDPGGRGPQPITFGGSAAPRPPLTGQPGLAGSRPANFSAIVGTPALTSHGQMTGPGSQAYSWHLSVVNGGAPRAVADALAEDSNIWRQAGYLSSTDWQRYDMNAATWSFTNTLSNGEITNIDRQIRFGMNDGVPLGGDFDGDGTDEVAVFKDGYWMIDINRNGRWDESDLLAKLGGEEDRPVVGDWDGDGKDDIGIYGPMWERDPEAIALDPGLPNPENTPFTKPKNIPPDQQESTNGGRVMKLAAYGRQRADVIDHVFGTGEKEDVPVAGDWNGNGIRSIGTFRSGIWHLDVNGDGRFDYEDATARFGRAGDVPLVGDFNGDGIEEIAVYRSGTFLIDSNGNRELDATDKTFEMGGANDKPVIGDWDGDGIDEPGVYSQSSVSIY